MDDPTGTGPQLESSAIATEPPQPPTGVTPAREAAAPAPRRRRGWVWALVGVLVVAAAAGGYLYYSRAQAQAKAASDAEAHWEAAARSLATIKVVSDAIDTADPSADQASTAGWATSLEKVKATATPELDACAAAVAQMTASPARQDFISAIQSARDALRKADEAQPGIALLPDLYSKVAQVNTAMDRVHDRVNAAVTAGNAGKYAQASKGAAQAIADCNAAERVLREIKAFVAKNSLPSDLPRVDAAIDAVRRERAVASTTAAIAKLGNGGSASAYNAAIDRYDKAVTAADKASIPDFLANPSLLGDRALVVLHFAKDSLAAAITSHDKYLSALVGR